jgi:hypothetical protein
MTDLTPRYPHGRLQFVWWWRSWWRLRPQNVGPYPCDGPNKGIIYTWRVAFGPLEVRRWSPSK